MNTRKPIRPMILWAAAAAAAVLAQGCGPVGIDTRDQQALRSIQRIAVLPVTDAPHAQSAGSGWSARGGIIQGLHSLGKYDLLSVSPDDIRAAAEQTGYDLKDCSDPYVAAELGRWLGADAVVCGELTHWSTRQEQDSSSLLIVSSGGTKTYHCVGLSLRIVQTSNAEIIYSGMGDGRSDKGYTSAVEAAIKQGMSSLRQFCRTMR